jgi:Zinc finger, C2H2 type
LEYTSGTHSFEHHSGQRVEVPEFGEFQFSEITQDFKNNEMDSKEWPCHYDGCDKSYGRRQEVIRHIREKHAILPKCSICGIELTRAEKIRKHLLFKHRRYFTKEERQEISFLRGLDNTIDFLKKWEITRL